MTGPTASRHRVNRGRVIRPRTGTCAHCGEPIFLCCVDTPNPYYVYCHESTGSIDTRDCRKAIHALDPQPGWAEGHP